MRCHDQTNSDLPAATVDPRLVRDMLARNPHEIAAKDSAYGQRRDIMARERLHTALPSDEPELR